MKSRSKSEMKKTHNTVTGQGSAFSRYRRVIFGPGSLLRFFYYEWCQLLAPIPGALGMVLRKIFWPFMFASCGRGALFGTGVVVRHPGRIRIGSRVVISENCILDGRSAVKNETITLGDNVILSNNVMLSCKEGRINIGARTGINAQSIIQSTNDCPVIIGPDCIIGQQCFIVGGGSYHLERCDIPICEQGIRPDGGVVLKEDVWLGGRVTVLGGVVMGQGSVAAAGAVVTKSVPAFSVCMGVPARVTRNRADA